MNITNPIDAEKTETLVSVPPPIADDHRLKCYWEVIYDNKINLNKFKKIDLASVNDLRDNGDHLKHYVININSPDDHHDKPNTKRLIIKDAIFDTCDFLGNNDNQKITFDNCIFKKVYFGHSIFNDVNFVGCIFKKTSFSLSRFNRCSFNEKCSYKKVSISGGKTIFEDTNIVSADFINNAYKYATDSYCSKRNLNKHEQEYRQYSSLVKLSRNIIASVSQIGDDDIYYNAIKTLFKLRVKEKELKIKLDSNQIETIIQNKQKPLKKIKYRFKLLWNRLHCLLFPIEKLILNSFGFINGWGNSFIRCIGFGMLILLSYTIIYTYQSWESPSSIYEVFTLILKSYIKSLDITLLIGYTKYNAPPNSLFSDILLQSNMLFGLIWYGVSFPTLINKISMARI